MTTRLDEAVLDGFGPNDVTRLFHGLERWDHCLGWSTRGQSVSPRFLDERLSDPRVALQRVAREPGGDAVGVLQVAQVDQQNRHAHLTLLLDGGLRDLARTAVAQFLGLAFRDVPLRMLYLAAAAEQLAVIDHVGDAAREIGRLRAHERRAAVTHVDIVMYEIAPTDVSRGG